MISTAREAEVSRLKKNGKNTYSISITGVIGEDNLEFVEIKTKKLVK